MPKNKSVNEFVEGDLVAVFGGALDKDSHVADTVTLCHVEVVGQLDLVVKNSENYMSTRHIVPKAICFNLKLTPSILASSHTLVPELGDLVVSFARGYNTGDTERTSGILYKIIYRLGKPNKCILLCGTEMVTLDWGHLLVLHREKTLD
jgi:hypothetical protein